MLNSLTTNIYMFNPLPILIFVLIFILVIGYIGLLILFIVRVILKRIFKNRPIIGKMIITVGIFYIIYPLYVIISSIINNKMELYLLAILLPPTLIIVVGVLIDILFNKLYNRKQNKLKNSVVISHEDDNR